MWMLILFLGIVFILTADLCYMLKKQPVIVLPLSFSIICIWEYVFSLINMLKYSVGLFLVILAGLSIYLWKKNKTDINMVRKFFSVGIIIYMIYAVVFWIFYQNKITRGGDEYSIWATTVKHLYYFDVLPCNGESNVQYNVYLPGIALCKYFFMKLQQSYVDNLLYKVHAMWTVSLMMPLFSKINGTTMRKRVCEIFLKALVCIVIPSTLFTECYSGITVDCILGLLFAYGIMLIFSQEHDKGFYVCEFLVCSTLVLTKETGLVLAVALLLSIYIDDYLKYGIKNVIKKFWILLGIAFPYLTWKVYIKIYGVTVDAVLDNYKISVKPLAAIVTGNADQKMYEVLHKFFIAFFSYDSSESYNSVLPITSFGYLLIVICCLVLIKNSIGKRRCLGLTTGILIGTVGYYAMLIYTYLVVYIDSPVIMILPSYKRYIMSWWSGIIVGLLMVYELVVAQTEKRRMIFRIVVICWMGLSLARVTAMGGRGYWDNATSVRYRETYTARLEKYLPTLTEEDRVYIIAQDNGSLYLQSLYLLTPVWCNANTDEIMKTPTFSLGVNEENKNSATDYSIDEWVEKLTDYTYVYVCVSDDRFVKKYGELFVSDVADDTLYKIIRTQTNRIKLEKVELTE